MATVFVYNGFGEDVISRYTGIPWTFPTGKLTPVPDQALREVDIELTYGENAEKTGEEGVHYKGVNVTGERVAHELVIKHGLDAWGLEILTENKISEDVKRQAEERGMIYKRSQINEFLSERIRAQSGGIGRLDPEPRLMRWIKELQIEDAIINPSVRRDGNAAGGSDAIAVALIAVAESNKRLAAALEPAGTSKR